MSNAARKARKREQRNTGERYQHPTRDGVPYGRSKPPSLADMMPSPERIAATAAMVAAAREGWGGWSRSW